MNNNLQLRNKISEAFGKEAFFNGNLNKQFLAKLVFNDAKALQKLNSLVHPYVRTGFSNWCAMQNNKYIIKEAAILFESGAYKSCNYIILVTADEATRVSRVVKRDQTTEEDVMKRIRKQWNEDKKKKLADFCITNNSGLNQLREKYQKLKLDLDKLK